MRGFPLLNLLAALLLSGAVLLPLVFQATRPAVAVIPSAGSSTATTTVSASSRIRFSLRFVHPPKQVRFETSGGDKLYAWTGQAGALTVEDFISLPLESGRAEFAVKIDWPDGTPETIAELHVEPDGLPAQTVNLWSTGTSVDEVVSLEWKGARP